MDVTCSASIAEQIWNQVAVTVALLPFAVPVAIGYFLGRILYDLWLNILDRYTWPE